jgi:hypothetical protein
VLCGLGAWRGAVHGANTHEKDARNDAVTRPRKLHLWRRRSSLIISTKPHLPRSSSCKEKKPRTNFAPCAAPTPSICWCTIPVLGGRLEWPKAFLQQVSRLPFCSICFLTRGVGTSSRPLYALLGLLITLLLSVVAGYFGFQRGRKQQISHIEAAADV